MNAQTATELLKSTVVGLIMIYALSLTGFLILFIGFRPKNRVHPLRFSPGEFLVAILYRMAATMTGIAEGADSFLTAYREISRDTRFVVRSKVIQIREEDANCGLAIE